MNKDQKLIAEDIIECLKKYNGKTTFDTINKEVGNNDLVNTSTILQNLEDLGIVKDDGMTLFRLTSKGWEFKSLAELYRRNLYKNIKKEIRYYVQIVIPALSLIIAVWAIKSKPNTMNKQQLQLLKEEVEFLHIEVERLQNQSSLFYRSDSLLIENIPCQDLKNEL